MFEEYNLYLPLSYIFGGDDIFLELILMVLVKKIYWGGFEREK